MGKYREVTPELLNKVVDHPKSCSCAGCINQRHNKCLPKKDRLTIQERKFLESSSFDENKWNEVSNYDLYNGNF